MHRTIREDPDTACFDIRGLRRVYGKGPAAVEALRGVDLQIPERELVVILGASGSGKSTFLNIIGGLDQATAGEVLFRGSDLSRASSAELTEYRRRHVGFVFQFYNLMPSLTAWENVALITEIAEAPLAPADALALVGLGDRMDHFPAQLSGGGAATCRDRPGGCQAAHGHVVRRTHGRARFCDWRESP